MVTAAAAAASALRDCLPVYRRRRQPPPGVMHRIIFWSSSSSAPASGSASSDLSRSRRRRALLLAALVIAAAMFGYAIAPFLMASTVVDVSPSSVSGSDTDIAVISTPTGVVKKTPAPMVPVVPVVTTNDPDMQWKLSFLAKECNAADPVHDGIYGIGKFMVSNIYETGTIWLSGYQGKFTPQYYTLNALHDEFADSPFDILGLPCNQFNLQEPGANATEILNTMRYVRPGFQQGSPFEAKFQLTKKVDVNGEDQIPLYAHLKRLCPPPWEQFKSWQSMHWSPLHAADVRWNFEKFLVDKRGVPRFRFHSNTDPMRLREIIRTLIDEQ